MRPVDKLERGVQELLVGRLHTLLRERAGVFAFLLAPRSEAWIVAGRFAGGRKAVHHAARSEPRLELRILRIVRVLGLLLRVEVIEVAEKLIEPMHGREELV